MGMIEDKESVIYGITLNQPNNMNNGSHDNVTCSSVTTNSACSCRRT